MNKDSNKTQDDEKNLEKYRLDQNSVSKLTKEKYLFNKIRLGLIDAGYPTAKVDEVFKNKGDTLP